MKLNDDVEDNVQVNHVMRKIKDRISSRNCALNYNIRNTNDTSGPLQKKNPSAFYGSQKNIHDPAPVNDPEMMTIRAKKPILTRLSMNKRVKISSVALNSRVNAGSIYNPMNQIYGSIIKPLDAIDESNRQLDPLIRTPIESFNIANLQSTISKILEQKSVKMTIPSPGIFGRDRESSSSRLVKRLTSSMIRDNFDDNVEIPLQRPGSVISAVAALEDAKKRKVAHVSPDVLATSGVSFSMQALEILNQQVDEVRKEEEDLLRNIALLKAAKSCHQSNFGDPYVRSLVKLDQSMNDRKFKLIDEISEIDRKTEKTIEQNSILLRENKQLETTLASLKIKQSLSVNHQGQYRKTLEDIKKLKESLDSHLQHSHWPKKDVQLALMKVAPLCVTDGDEMISKATILEKRLLLS